MNRNRQKHNVNFNFSTIMKKVLLVAALLIGVTGASFAQEKAVKEAKKSQTEQPPILQKQKN